VSPLGEAMSCGDMNLWERHTAREPQPDGSLICTLMAEGAPVVRAKFERGSKPRVMIEQWYNHVRSTVDAWENEQTAKAAKRAEAPRAGGERKDETPVIHGGSEVATPQADKARQESVESILESKVADLGRSVALVEAQIAATLGALKSLESERDALKKQRQKAVAAIRAMKEA